MRAAKMLGPLVLLLALFSTGCAVDRIGPGHVGVQISLAGSNRGTDLPPITTGWVVYNPFTTSVYEYPTFMQTAKWTKDPQEGHPNNEEISFKSKEGVQMYADINLSYVLDANRVPHFYVKYRSEDLDAFTHGYLRNLARNEFVDIASTYGVDDINGPKLQEFLDKVKTAVNTQIAPEGVEIQQLGFLGNIRLPDSYNNAMLAKQTAIQQAQQAENELRVATAQAAKQVATAQGQANSRIALAEGEAKANDALARSITPNLIAWRELDIKQQAVQRWQGHVPTVTGGTNGSGTNLVIPVTLPK